MAELEHAAPEWNRDWRNWEECLCGRGPLPPWTWLCTICYLEKEINYALSELEREGEAWEDHSWFVSGIQRLYHLIGVNTVEPIKSAANPNWKRDGRSET